MDYTLTPLDIERFWAKLDMPSIGCWNWTASLNAKGYGQFFCKRRGKSKSFRAHRLAYQLSVGDIPEGMSIDHMCHNKSCARPSHLRVTTNKENHENLSGANRNSTSGIRGVCWDKGRQMWKATVMHNNRTYNLGVFMDIAEAEAAVIAKRNELFTHNDLDRLAA